MCRDDCLFFLLSLQLGPALDTHTCVTLVWNCSRIRMMVLTIFVFGYDSMAWRVLKQNGKASRRFLFLGCHHARTTDISRHTVVDFKSIWLATVWVSEAGGEARRLLL